MESALNQLKLAIAEGVEKDKRPQYMLQIQHLAYSLEETNETIHRYGHGNLRCACIKVALDLGIFGQLAASDGPLSLRDIAERTGGNEALLNRLMRFLSAIWAVQETGKGQFIANTLTKNLSERVAKAGISHFFETTAPLAQSLPRYLEENKYQNPDHELHTTFQAAHKTNLSTFEWMTEHPDHLAYFNDYMALRREPNVTWLTVYPVQEETKDWDPSKAVFVDVGGGIGHQCAQFKEKYPDVPGLVILQDMPHSIAVALNTPKVENMVHDFFEPQPIKGAKFYHMRGILHDHCSYKVRQVLEATKSAMTSESILLVDEMIFPEVGVNSHCASIDITMLEVLAGMERTEEQWKATFKDVGLELVNTYTYNPLSYESVMDVRLPMV
ncbi:hypothetical protein HYFRA_00006359 [Hymenoscyphus fraxineus]|uniref:O-methyltransferase domain-containing protein n=1 Tax=Hymenoscyphus fraxineus TaxID=746836 RepID=A0A9N9PQZ1_9HELO|nr:hypothetical protein HYFRA_00006359 [Hymenoscyphus fraxineus]